MTRAGACPKCRGEMGEGTEEVFGKVFECSRNLQYLGKMLDDRIPTYYCKKCRYNEFYRREGEHPRIEEADKKGVNEKGL
jgi:predicted nucleic-acid-binding Zn-ribbon protein